MHNIPLFWLGISYTMRVEMLIVENHGNRRSYENTTPVPTPAPIPQPFRVSGEWRRGGGGVVAVNLTFLHLWPWYSSSAWVTWLIRVAFAGFKVCLHYLNSCKIKSLKYLRSVQSIPLLKKLKQGESARISSSFIKAQQTDYTQSTNSRRAGPGLSSFGDHPRGRPAATVETDLVTADH